MLEKGIYSEETKGDLDAAIALYQQVIAEAKAGQALGAQAQFRLAQCYLKKSKTVEATAAFEKLIHDFPNEQALIAKARAYLPSDLSLTPVPWVDGERLQLTLMLSGGLEIGTMELRADLVEVAGKKAWRVGRLMSGGEQMVSSVDVDPNTFRPLTSRWKHTLLGEATTVYGPTEIMVRRPDQPEAQKVPVDKVVFDNEECFHLPRRLPLKDGYKAAVPIITPLGGGAVMPLEFAVVKKETIEVPAGKFDCFKVEIKPLAQSFWISDDAHRYLVKFEGGGALGVLASIAQRKLDEPTQFRQEAAGISFTAPAGWVVHFRAKTKPVAPDSAMLFDPEADAELAVMNVYATEALKEDSRKSARKWAETDFQENHAKALKDAKIRPESWKETTVAGHPGVSFIGDYTENGKPRVAYAIYAIGAKVAEQFVLAAAPDKFEALKAEFERIVGSYKNTK